MPDCHLLPYRTTNCDRSTFSRLCSPTQKPKTTAPKRSVYQSAGGLCLERFRLRALVARWQLERGKELAAGPREAQLEWQVELLNNEVDRLKEERARVDPFVRYYPIYWYW